MERWFLLLLLLTLLLALPLPLPLLPPAAPPVIALAIAMREGDRRDGEGDAGAGEVALRGDEGPNAASDVMQRRMPAEE